MIRRLLQRAFLVGMFSAWASFGTARADGPPAPVPLPGPSCATCDSQAAGEQKHSLKEKLHSHPICSWVKREFHCYGDFDNMYCGSGKSECKFIFGSCRDFFGDPCLKGPPPPIPYGPGLGFAADGCRCR